MSDILERLPRSCADGARDREQWLENVYHRWTENPQMPWARRFAGDYPGFVEWFLHGWSDPPVSIPSQLPPSFPAR